MNAKGDCWQGVTDNTLELLLNETYAIDKKPWTPKNGDTYYYIFGTKDSANVNKTRFVTAALSDLLRLRTGNYFRTKEEAKANVEKWIKYLKQEPDLSWRE